MGELNYPDPPLTDGTIVLRAFSEADVPAIVVACSDPVTSRFLHEVPVPYSDDDARAWLAMQGPGRASGRRIEFAIVATADSCLLGAIGCSPDFANAKAEIGYWLTPAARGSGHMTAAVRLLCGYLFEQLEFGRIELTNDPLNVGSQNVAARCGFIQEGYMRAHIFDRRIGSRRDSLIWGLVRG